MGDLAEGVAHYFFVRYGTMISSIILRASAVLLKCFGFMLSFIVNVAVMALLSDNPVTGIDFVPNGARVVLDDGTNFEGV